MSPNRRACFFGLRLLAFSLVLTASAARLGAQIRDGGIDPRNLGKGEWIYILPNAINQMGGHVPGVTNLASLMAYQKNLGCEYVIIKAGDGGTKFPSNISPQFTSTVVDAGHAAGLKVFGYNFSFGTDIAGEIAMADYVFNQGADGFVVDAEGAWESQNLPNNTAAAIALMSGIRTNWPNKFLAHSPFPIISFHSSFPYKEFGYYCDVVMPQDYWNEIGSYVSSSPTIMLQKMNTEYKNWQNTLTGIWTNAIKPIVPAGQGWSDGTNYTTTAAQITEFYNALKTIAGPATAGGYKGVNWWRAELHPTDVLAAIRTNNIGNTPTNAPTIANVSVAIADVSVTITWTTEQSSDSVVEYGFSASYGSAITNSTALWYHTVNVGGLSPNTTYHYRVKSSNAASQQGVSGDFVFTTLAAPVPDILIDDTAATLSGAWSTSTHANAYNGSYTWGSTAASEGRTATFRPTINTAGNYDVYVIFVQGSNRSTNAPWTISYNGGSITVPVNESGPANASSGWVKIGSAIPFVAGTDGYVRLGNNTGGTGFVVLADGVKFVYLPPAPSPPSIATQPQNQTVTQGNTAMFTVNASGSGPLSYQWRRSGTNLPGATLSAYTKNNAQPADAGIYSVFITNSVGTMLSSNATLTVNVPPMITDHPESISTNAGADVTFSVTATGTAPLSYQWRFNSDPIPGATLSSLTKTNVQLADAGAYSVIVSNIAGTTVSADATLTLPPTVGAPHIDLITLLPEGNAHLLISGGPGNFAIDAGPTLSGFTQVTSFSVTNAVFEFIDAETNQPNRFFRVRMIP